MIARRTLLVLVAALASCGPTRPALARVKALLDRIAGLPSAGGPAISVAEHARHLAVRDAQAPLFRQLEAMGSKAVPAMIALMDDRRPVPFPELELENRRPDRFEQIRHYSPQLMVDAVAAILNQITGEDFGFIYNGATEAERQAAVVGWRRYRASLAQT